MQSVHSSVAHPISENALKFSFWTAGANWVSWVADFEFGGDKARLPVLEDQDRYRVFTSEYRLLRYYTMEKRESLRIRLLDSDDFRNAVMEPDGSGIDSLAIRLAEENPGFNVERSFISKLAAFSCPENFVAWDRFARSGVAQLTGLTNRNYQEYLSAVNSVLQGHIGKKIKSYLRDNQLPTTCADAFARRVLDVYLMMLGGRWPTINLSEILDEEWKKKKGKKGP